MRYKYWLVIGVVVMILTFIGCKGASVQVGDIVFPNSSPNQAPALISPMPIQNSPIISSYQPIPTPLPTELVGNIPAGISFEWESMPTNDSIYALGQIFSVEGTIKSGYPITEVRVVVYNALNGTKELDQTAKSDHLGKKMYQLSGYSGSINELAPFSKLGVGEKRLELLVSTTEESDIPLWKASFSIQEWVTLTKDRIHFIFTDFLDDYFGSSDYLFKYKLRERGSRRIFIDSEWTDKYIRQITFNGRAFSVHTTAYDTFKRAFDHVKNSYVYIKYNNGESGVFALSDAMVYNLSDGAFTARFQDASCAKISHHSFGTCIDLNSTLEVNKIRVIDGHDTNWEQIKRAIDKLTYDGLNNVYGRDKVYCFTYDGTMPENGMVPNTLLNYLLHEIAFAREGFHWGGYFGNGSDAMHFSLTEPNDYGAVYPEGSTATADHQRIQKVFEYAE